MRTTYKLLWAIYEEYAKRLPSYAPLDFDSIKGRFKQLYKGKSLKKKVKNLAWMLSMEMGVDPYTCVRR